MRLDLFVKLKYQSNTKIFLVLNIVCVTYFMTSITMPGPKTNNMRHI